MQSRQFSDLNILLIDDNMADRCLFIEAVSDVFPNACVTEKETLRDGIKVAGNRNFDIIVVDLGLPDSTGLDTVISATLNLKASPIVFLTGAANAAFGAQAIAFGAQDFCTKENMTKVTVEKTITYAMQRFSLAKENRVTISELQEKNHTLRDFVSIVSHDLRTPVGSIVAACESYNSGNLHPEATHQLIHLIGRSSLRAHTLINTLMAINTLESGKSSLQKSDFLLETSISEIVYEMQKEIERKRLKITSIGTHLTVHADRNQVLRIFSNLLGNAIRFTPYSGTILIQANHRAHDVLISVTDSGLGVAPEIIRDLFRKEIKTVRPDPGGESGTGFGLPLVAEILKAHGSKIRIQNLEKTGARFSFILQSNELSAVSKPGWQLGLP